jgi:hypothetical protein
VSILPETLKNMGKMWAEKATTRIKGFRERRNEDKNMVHDPSGR